MASSETSVIIEQAIKAIAEGLPEPGNHSGMSRSSRQLLMNQAEALAISKTEARNVLANQFFEETAKRLRARFPHRDPTILQEAVGSAFRVVDDLIVTRRFEWLDGRGPLCGLVLKVAGQKALNKLRDEARRTRHLVTSTDMEDAESTRSRVEGVPEPGSVGMGPEALVLELLENAKDDLASPERRAVIEAVTELIGKTDIELQLPEIILCLLEKRDNKEIADRIGRSVQTVVRRREQIREILKREEDR